MHPPLGSTQQSFQSRVKPTSTLTTGPDDKSGKSKSLDGPRKAGASGESGVNDAA